MLTLSFHSHTFILQADAAVTHSQENGESSQSGTNVHFDLHLFEYVNLLTIHDVTISHTSKLLLKKKMSCDILCKVNANESLVFNSNLNAVRLKCQVDLMFFIYPFFSSLFSSCGRSFRLLERCHVIHEALHQEDHPGNGGEVRGFQIPVHDPQFC